MLNREDLQVLVIEAMKSEGGSANIVSIAKYIWRNHSGELKESGDLFYTWQYDIRWAANELRSKAIMKDADSSPRGLWELR